MTTFSDLLNTVASQFHAVDTALIALFNGLAAVSTILALTLPWKSEAACSSTSLTLASDGYDKFVPKHNEALYRGYAALSLLLLPAASWLPLTRALILTVGAGWFLLNEAIIELSAIRCAGADQGTVKAGLFAAYGAIVFTVWSVYGKV
tara:strand:- start:12128 stop:12574 length:447 start_codon:yes stop_codon:yes gene_type:complete